MATKYLQELESLMSRLSVGLPGGVEVAFKHFFGGAAMYAGGRICITLSAVGLAMKLPEEARERLKGEGARPLRYFPEGPVKKHYVVLPPRILDDEEKLAFWARQSVGHVLSLPAPGKG